MRYPVSLIDKLSKVEDVYNSWGSSIRYDEVVNWILQFDSDDYDLAIRILSNINYLNFGDIKSALSIAYSKLIRKSIDKGTKITHKNTLFAGLGENGKSGSMISYNFRVINELSEENFAENDELIETGNIENIVLIDDILSTGHQASKEIINLTEKVTPLGVKNIFLLTVCGMKEGITRIEEETKAYTFSAIEYSSKDTVNDLDGNFYIGLSYEDRVLLRKRIEYYGKIAYPKNPLGFGDIGALIAFDFNTPNTSIPLIWSDANSWIPLFKRARRINGIKSYYKQFERQKEENQGADINQKKEEIFNANPTEDRVLLIYVEGKTEETFFDLLQKEKNLASDLGFDKVNIIALGGAILSEKLMSQLASSKHEQVFLIERDQHSEQIIQKYRNSNIKIVLMAPNVLGFFKIKEILKNEGDKQQFEVIFGYDITDGIFFDLERIMFRKVPLSQRQNLIKEYINKYFDEEKYNDFIKDMNNTLHPKSKLIE